MKITSKKVMVVLGVLLLASVITATAGCVSDDEIIEVYEEDILGTWQSDNSITIDDDEYDVEYVFKEIDEWGNRYGDKTSVADGKFATTSFHWEYLGSGEFKVDISFDGGTEMFTLSGDTLTDGDGNTYHRA